MAKDKVKEKVSWTIDPLIIIAVRKKALELAEETGLRVSESAAANFLLQQAIKKETANAQA